MKRSPGSRALASWLTAAIIACFSPYDAYAHGGPPSALGLVAADETGPKVVLLNEGLAFREADGRWSYGCPSLWGQTSLSAGKVPHALSLDGRSTWVIGVDDLYMSENGALIPQGRADLNGNAVVALGGSQAGLFGLRNSATGSEIVRIGATYEAPVWTSEENVYWFSLDVAGDTFHLSRVINDSQARVLSLDAQGQVLQETTLTFDRMPSRVTLRSTPRGLYGVLYDGNLHYTLGVVADGTWQVLHEVDNGIFGPQASPNGQLYVAIAGQLHRITDAGIEPAGETPFLTCLDQWADRPYACAGSDLYWLEDDGLGERAFALGEFFGPNPANVPPAVAETCGFQWTLFRADLTMSGYSPKDYVPPADAGAVEVPTGAAGMPPMAAAGSGEGVAGVGEAPAGAAGSSGDPGQPPMAAEDTGGCSSAGPGSARPSGPLACLLFGAALALIRLRRRPRPRR